MGGGGGEKDSTSQEAAGEAASLAKAELRLRQGGRGLSEKRLRILGCSGRSGGGVVTVSAGSRGN